MTMNVHIRAGLGQLDLPGLSLFPQGQQSIPSSVCIKTIQFAFELFDQSAFPFLLSGFLVALDPE